MMSFSTLRSRTSSSVGPCTGSHMPTNSVALFSAFYAELCTFHNSLGPKTQAENSNVYLGQDDSEKLPEK